MLSQISPLCCQTIDVALNAADVDPIIFSVSKTLLFNNLVKLFPELVSHYTLCAILHGYSRVRFWW